MQNNSRTSVNSGDKWQKKSRTRQSGYERDERCKPTKVCLIFIFEEETFSRRTAGDSSADATGRLFPIRVENRNYPKLLSGSTSFHKCVNLGHRRAIPLTGSAALAGIKQIPPGCQYYRRRHAARHRRQPFAHRKFTGWLALPIKPNRPV